MPTLKSRSVYSGTLEIMMFPQIKSIALIAEGVPESYAREILHLAQSKGVLIIGPATDAAMRRAGFIVPDILEDLPQVLCKTYQYLVAGGTIMPKA